jgi:hypothetical protein
MERDKIMHLKSSPTKGAFKSPKKMLTKSPGRPSGKKQASSVDGSEDEHGATKSVSKRKAIMEEEKVMTLTNTIIFADLGR